MPKCCTPNICKFCNLTEHAQNWSYNFLVLTNKKYENFHLKIYFMNTICTTCCTINQSLQHPPTAGVISIPFKQYSIKELHKILYASISRKGQCLCQTKQCTKIILGSSQLIVDSSLSNCICMLQSFNMKSCSMACSLSMSSLQDHC
uniref:Uncharacterized protein n=1 Tax=Opuntia streptacantha TaxID=393608 RepID=A0A7C9EXK1_OPUST